MMQEVYPYVEFSQCNWTDYTGSIEMILFDELTLLPLALP